MLDNKNYDRNDFIKMFNAISNHKHRYEVFRDFVTISAISLHNAVQTNSKLEEEYLQTIARYDKNEISKFPELLAILVKLLQAEPRDILGRLYMELELGNDNTGQFFTPSEVSLMMARMSYDDKQAKKSFITLSEPASGAGGMVLAFAKIMMDHGHNPACKLWVECVDTDRLVALMCYLQLSLWNIPAKIIVGDSLSLETRETFYTPAHYLYGWEERLRSKRTAMYGSPEIPETDKTESETQEIKQTPAKIQLDLTF